MPDTIAIAGAFPQAPLRATTTSGTRARSLAPLAHGRTGTPMAHTACEFEGFCDACLFHAVAAGRRTFMMATGRSAGRRARWCRGGLSPSWMRTRAGVPDDFFGALGHGLLIF